MLVEINFDGIVGPSHNYAGLSPGNLASQRNRGATSHPRAAALQGLEKMRANLHRGLAQGFFLPQPRPDTAWLAALGCSAADAPPALLAAAMSASPMWAANAATVSPAPDCADGRCHLTVANLRSMAHRSHEWPFTLRQLELAFSDGQTFAVHGPVPPAFGDEGAANHMRLSAGHAAPGVEVFVYGCGGGAFPARQHEQASRAVARLHRLDPARTLFACQSANAIAAGAFHNDVVAVANGHVLLAHEQAFEEPAALYAALRAAVPEFELVEVPAALVTLEEAIGSYLFNAQLLSLPGGGMTLLLPTDAKEIPAVVRWLEHVAAGNSAIREVDFADVRESMANGGGPACLRLRVVADPATVDPRFLATATKLNRIAEVVEARWPESIAPAELADPRLHARLRDAHEALADALDLPELCQA
ncbi:MAG: Succinylarginine dihydrolase [uncultured Sphingomonadaceae bacterium]|uniref:N-succinylarginine dihydrolase n=1 Tax=uncultured Sphingomonadaceae bacterium TaxID=169976 RepID=A0A6J4SUL3_9SPHN|nr:MAG: Succinylarginine dihydrolase [uncultured Sphingomonadaceae bacterium]